jgi:hypothetical protein
LRDDFIDATQKHTRREGNIMAGPRDAHAKPPEAIRQVYKHFQKLKPDAVDQDSIIIDTLQLRDHPGVSLSSLVQLPTNVRQAFTDFAGAQIRNSAMPAVYSVNGIPGKSANLNIGRAMV